VGFASAADYRAAVRRHRSWAATIALFVVATLAWFALLGVFGTGVVIHVPLWVGVLMALALGLATLIVDAAHRVAGERQRLK
jgi:dolichol kinase